MTVIHILSTVQLFPNNWGDFIKYISPRPTLKTCDLLDLRWVLESELCKVL